MSAPHFDLRAAERIARERFGIDAIATDLPSERDQNFLLTPSLGDPIVLKIANAAEDRSFLEAEQRAMQHVARTFSLAPRVLPSLDGSTLGECVSEDGRTHLVWAVSMLSGVPLATVPHKSPALLAHFGETIAQLTLALRDFDDPALHRELGWDLAEGRLVVDRYLPLVNVPALGDAISTLISRFDRHTAPHLASLRRSVIHNDLNDYNVLADAVPVVDAHIRRVTGVIDFGDMVHSYTVADLAIASAYAVLDAGDPLSTLARMVRAYHAAHPLTEAEMAALFGLVILRLCMSACLGAHQQGERPDNAYLSVSQQAVQRTLPRLARIPFRFAEATVRSACALEPIASSARVRTWLAEHSLEFAPVLGVDLRVEPSLVLDLSVGSLLVSGDPLANAEPALTERVFTAMREADVSVAIGRYDEARVLYTAPFFDAGDGTTNERRTIHVGLDLFCEAGKPVYAPFDGEIHLFGRHDEQLDYGAVIILRHVLDDGTEFFTLYGHLSRASLNGLHAGQIVLRGEQIGTLGEPHENGGWTPHLHFQLITDLLDLDSGFSGVGTASRRAVWRSISPDPNLIVGVPRRRFPLPPPGKEVTLTARRALMGGNVSIAYRDPVRAARGWRQYMYDDEGRRYLDAYNNVPHVGHAHPRVVRAAAAQMAVLNTNTRYLHDTVVQYAERLTETFPASLDVCFLLNSASEANELALRLARAYTGQRDMIVLEAAYHGNTTSLVDISPYKHAGPGGRGAPEWVHVAPLPDVYRGAFTRDDADAGRKYAAMISDVIAGVRRQSRDIAGFIAETCPSVGGQIMLPDGYLAAAYEAVRAAGGVCIADEVQTGLGRIGTHFWAFEAHGVVPDIVVLGKPLGNGHPLAAVVTTRAIADAFDNGMEFFSTFGGNTVSCAVGLAVLDVMHDEGLQAHALRVGDRMLSQLRSLASDHDLIGDVRGSGLFLGIELVKNRASLEPATGEATYVANRMREEGILLGTDGPYHNVIKIRPPMPFSEEDGDFLVATLDRVLRELS